ncbi:ribosome assembly RNA-binding protein YhbY [Methylogaea oryzae]|uniref:CRM domain-containing protein n=1 Tax=Methylogaea oryzae TaxID=1295382 RepID=A0A8D4VPH4_9GAMM|nr:ribosome assembly RNA-binding protein YhbY [Methylogaea oryzae]BBL71660.1 hypothetical protein MoryE10_22660 [Methylogaea oryzae]
MTPQLKKALRAKAHALKPVIITGQAGLTEAVLAEIDNALNHHELIKVRLRNDDREQRQEMGRELCEQLKADLVQSLGQIVTLYRKNPERPKAAKPPARSRPAARKPSQRRREGTT